MQLDLAQLTKGYRLNRTTVTIIKETNLSLNENKLICITGKSGSGKSTLLNLIAGLLEPTSGRITFDGIQRNLKNDDENSFFRNDRMGYVMQGYSALDHLTVYENIVFPFNLYKRDENPVESARTLMKMLKIEHLKSKYPRNLSGGELKRMCVARALINKPAYLLADEPTNDLDEKNIKIIMQLFRKIAKEDTLVIIATHNLDILSYADETYEISNGTLMQKRVDNIIPLHYDRKGNK